MVNSLQTTTVSSWLVITLCLGRRLSERERIVIHDYNAIGSENVFVEII